MIKLKLWYSRFLLLAPFGELVTDDCVVVTILEDRVGDGGGGRAFLEVALPLPPLALPLPLPFLLCDDWSDGCCDGCCDNCGSSSDAGCEAGFEAFCDFFAPLLAPRVFLVMLILNIC